MPSAKDEVARRSSARRDPRVDPDSIPAMPAVTGKAGEEQGGLRDVVAPRAKKRDPRADPESIPAMRAVTAEHAEDAVDVDTSTEEPAAEEERAAKEEAPAAEAGAAPADARLAEIEPLLDRTAWKEIADKLGPPEKAAELPPALGLIYALARREAAGDASAPGATELAIASVAKLVGVAPGSATALVLAKRLLRQNPASWRTRPAPPAKLSVAIVLIGLAIGVAAGSFLSVEAVHSFIKLF
jgi:hypothetical protein